jgi:hypothetical protein
VPERDPSTLPVRVADLEVHRAVIDERQTSQGRALDDLRAELRALKWTLAGVSAVAAALGAIAGALGPALVP